MSTAPSTAKPANPDRQGTSDYQCVDQPHASLPRSGFSKADPDSLACGVYGSTSAFFAFALNCLDDTPHLAAHTCCWCYPECLPWCEYIAPLQILLLASVRAFVTSHRSDVFNVTRPSRNYGFRSPFREGRVSMSIFCWWVPS